MVAGYIPLPSHEYVYFNLYLPEGYKLNIISFSSQEFPLLIFTLQQFNNWIKGINSKPVILTNISKGSYSFYLNPGNYVVVIDGANNSYPSPQNYEIFIVPYNALALLSQPRNSSAIGIVAYGVGNKSVCSVSTNAILGFFNITSLYAYNSSYNPQSGASLQLNTVLYGEDNQSLFLQDVIGFITSENQLQFVANVWNVSSVSALLNNSYFYSNYTHFYSYKLPLAGFLIINVSNVSNGMRISFGYVIIQNGTFVKPDIKFFNTVFFPFKGYLLIDPYNLTGDYHAYDAELVFGGYSGGEITSFVSLNASLALYYNSTYGWKPFRSLYTYSVNTGEGTTDLHVSIRDSYANVYVGNENLGLLTEKFNPPSPLFLYVFIIPYNYSFYLNSSYKIYFPENISGKYEFARLNYISVNGKTVNNGYVIPYPDLPREVYVDVNYTYYYYVNIMLPNGSTIKGWFKEGSEINIPKVIYLNTEERYVLENNSTLIVSQPLINYTPEYVLQYKATINNITEWLNQGSKIILYSPTFLLFNVKWVGTYNVSNGGVIEVNSPIIEKEVKILNYSSIMFLLIIIVIILIVFLIKRILS